MAFESITLSPNSEENRTEPKVKLTAQDFANLEEKLTTDRSNILNPNKTFNQKEKLFVNSLLRAEAVNSGIKNVTKHNRRGSSHDIEISSSDLRRFKYAELDGNMVQTRGQEREVKKVGGEIRSRWLEDNKRILDLTQKIEKYVASNERNEKTISALRSELIAAETLLNSHRNTIRELRADRSISKRIKDEADYYAEQDVQQINKLKKNLEEGVEKIKNGFVLDADDAFRDEQDFLANGRDEERAEYNRKKKARKILEKALRQAPVSESEEEENPKTTVEIEVETNMELEKKTNLGQIKNKIAANSLRFSRAQTALYSKKTSEGHTEFKAELSHILTDLAAITEEINDSEFQKEEFVANKNGTPETPEQKSKRNKRNDEARKKFEAEKTSLNEKTNKLFTEINKILAGGKSLEDILKDLGANNSDKLIKISEKAKLTKIEADKVLTEIKEALKKKGMGKGFSDLEKQEFTNKISSLFVDNVSHREDLGKIAPTPGKVVEAARHGVASDLIASIAYVINKAEETLEKKNELSVDEGFEKYQKPLKEERVKMLAKKTEIQKLDLEYKAGVEAEKLADKKEKLSILSQVEAEKKLAKTEHRRPNLKGIDTAALRVLRPLRRFFQFKYKAYKLSRESLINEARSSMDEVTYNYHRLAEFEGADLNQENQTNFIKTFTRSANFKNKTETQYELDSVNDIIAEKGKLKSAFKDMIGGMLEDGNGWGAVGAGLVMGLGLGTASVAGGVKNLFTENPNESAPLSASAGASQTANSINHPVPQASARNSGAKTAAFISGGVVAGAAATAFALSGAAAQAPNVDTTKMVAGPVPITAPAQEENLKPKNASIKEAEAILHFDDQDIDFTLRQMKNSDGSTDVILDMPANYADDNNMAARYDHAVDSMVNSIVTNPKLENFKDKISETGKLLINTGRETNIVIPIKIKNSEDKTVTVSEANFENPAMVKIAADRVANRFGVDYKSYRYTV